MPTALTVDHKVLSHQDWVQARRELLKREKEFTHVREGMAQKLRGLPWERAEKEYVVEGENGTVMLADLFVTPKGRNERGSDGKMVKWVKRHDQYDDQPKSSACCHDEAHA